MPTSPDREEGEVVVPPAGGVAPDAATTRHAAGLHGFVAVFDPGASTLNSWNIILQPTTSTPRASEGPFF